MEKVERIVKPFYDALEEGKVLARKCTKCGHVEYPPYLACNKCGNLDTEWIEFAGKGMVTHLLPVGAAFADTDFNKLVGNRVVGVVEIENSDPLNCTILGIKPEEIEELTPQLPLLVRPIITQLDGFKIVCWELDKES